MARILHCAWLPGLIARIPHCVWLPGSFGQDTSLCMTPRVFWAGYLTVMTPRSYGQDTSLCMTPRSYSQDTSLCMTPRVFWPGYLTVHDYQGLLARIPHCAWLTGLIARIPHCVWLPGSFGQDTSLCMIPRVFWPGYLTLHDFQGLIARIPHFAWPPGSYGQDTSLCMILRGPRRVIHSEVSWPREPTYVYEWYMSCLHIPSCLDVYVSY